MIVIYPLSRTFPMNTATTKNIEDGISYLHFYSGLNSNVLPIKERLELEKRSQIIKIKKKSALYYEGDAPKGLYILVRGKVKFSHLNPDGTEQIYFIYSSGDMFGYRAILSNSKHTNSVIAIEHCEFMFIETGDFKTILSGSSSLNDIFINSICKEYAALTNMINIFTRKSIKERTAYFLLVLNEKYRLPGQVIEESEITVSRIDLASYIGSSLENLVRTIREFKDKNYIRLYGKSIYINDFSALHALMGFQSLN
jgi:CRP-like cAMP-binding protein